MDHLALFEKEKTEEANSFQGKAPLFLESPEQGLKLIANLIDLTTLNSTDTDEKVIQLCQKALTCKTQVAAICVYPRFISTARTQLADSPIQLASVATGFPHGQIPLDLKVKEVEFAVQTGATEIDMVLSRGDFLSGRYDQVSDEIKKIKEACGKSHLKVILETGELESLDNIRKASDLAIQSGADFIKTSTGKSAISATLPAVLVMLESIKDHYQKTGKQVGIKPSGGIRTPEQALSYLALTENVLGPEWLCPELFRFGASSLLDEVLGRV